MRTYKIVSIVDDDESIRTSTASLVRSMGWEARVYESADHFLGSIGIPGIGGIGCIVCDVQMPGMNGLQLQSELVALGSSIPIIFITAYDNKDSRRRAMQAGAVAFLGKPFSDEQLLQTVRSAIRHDKGGMKSE